MKSPRLCFWSLIWLWLLCKASAAEVPAQTIEWHQWSDKIFEQAKAEHRFVLLDLGAGWCHWCHVMDEITYADPKVIELLRSRYLAVKVDQDSRPDLANRYEDYGWPATIVFNVDGSEIVKRQGYIPSKPMASLLQAIIDDPSPGPSVQPEPVVVAAQDAALTVDQRKAMRTAIASAYDQERGGWGTIHKYLNWNQMEYCLVAGAAGDSEAEEMAKHTLQSGLKLVDPAWGGVYQYSTDGDWDHPHFEKIMPFQAENMRVFALAAMFLREPKWIEPAQKIRGFLDHFLTSPEGAFYTSQDADLVEGEYAEKYFTLDDAGRRKLGVPRVDTHLYARENGLAITGLCSLYAASGDAAVLGEARKAMEWVQSHRSLAGGGFKHGESDIAGPYLADNLAMARALLEMYAVTAERAWLVSAADTASFMGAKFHVDAGFATAATGASASMKPKAQVDENIALARFCRLLFFYTGKDEFQQMAAHAMRYLASSTVSESQVFDTGGILLADWELGREPLHVTVVGDKKDPQAAALFRTALAGIPGYARVEWYDPSEGPLPHADVEYPAGTKARAFLCTSNSCSPPISTTEELGKKLAAAVRKQVH